MMRNENRFISEDPAFAMPSVPVPPITSLPDMVARCRLLAANGARFWFLAKRVIWFWFLAKSFVWFWFLAKGLFQPTFGFGFWQNE